MIGAFLLVLCSPVFSDPLKLGSHRNLAEALAAKTAAGETAKQLATRCDTYGYGYVNFVDHQIHAGNPHTYLSLGPVIGIAQGMNPFSHTRLRDFGQKISETLRSLSDQPAKVLENLRIVADKTLGDHNPYKCTIGATGLPSCASLFEQRFDAKVESASYDANGLANKMIVRMKTAEPLAHFMQIVGYGREKTPSVTMSVKKTGGEFVVVYEFSDKKVEELSDGTGPVISEIISDTVDGLTTGSTAPSLVGQKLATLLVGLKEGESMDLVTSCKETRAPRRPYDPYRNVVLYKLKAGFAPSEDGIMTRAQALVMENPRVSAAVLIAGLLVVVAILRSRSGKTVIPALPASPK